MTLMDKEHELPVGCKMRAQSRYASDEDCANCGLGEGDVCAGYETMSAANIAAKRAENALKPVAWRYRVSPNQLNWNFWGDSAAPQFVGIEQLEPLYAENRRSSSDEAEVVGWPDDMGLVAKLLKWADWLDADIGTDEPAGADVREAAAAIERLLAERDEARKLAEEGLEPRLRELHFGREGFSAEVTGQAVEATALAIVSYFKDLGAENFVEMNLFDRDDPFQRYNVTVQKVGALSPADKCRAAEAQRDTLKEVLTGMVQRFELYAGPNDMHAGNHDLALLKRARQALQDSKP